MQKTEEMEHAQQVALFRSEIIGALLHRELGRGQLAQELFTLSQQRFRPPGAVRTRTFSVPTLQRWLYAYKHKGLLGLRPQPRKDRGRGRHLTPALKTLLCDIRREHPEASVPLILRTLERDGRLDKGSVSCATVRRLLGEQGLDRTSLSTQAPSHTRLRWETSAPNALWHADVCYGPTLQIAGAPHPLRIHALLDDCSRFILCIAAFDTEREEEMLRLVVRALRAHGRPMALYLDNGPTYTGDLLRIACSRLDITLLHAKPYDPQARGKMERFWRTLREGCLAFLPAIATFPQVQERLDTFVHKHYHLSPHAALLGQCPKQVFTQAEPLPVDEATLREALTHRQRRRVRCDTTVSLDGKLFELDQGFLAGRVVTVASCLLDGAPPVPWVEWEGQRLVLHPCDPKLNAHRKRPPSGAPPPRTGAQVPFDPHTALSHTSDIDAPVSTEDAHDDDHDLSDPF